MIWNPPSLLPDPDRSAVGPEPTHASAFVARGSASVGTEHTCLGRRAGRRHRCAVAPARSWRSEARPAGRTRDGGSSTAITSRAPTSRPDRREAISRRPAPSTSHVSRRPMTEREAGVVRPGTNFRVEASLGARRERALRGSIVEALGRRPRPQPAPSRTGDRPICGPFQGVTTDGKTRGGLHTREVAGSKPAAPIEKYRCAKPDKDGGGSLIEQSIRDCAAPAALVRSEPTSSSPSGTAQGAGVGPGGRPFP
jgi:hypothetical protein